MRNSFIASYRTIGTWIVSISVFVELLFFPSTENLFGATVMLIGWGLLITTTITQDCFERYPVSFLMFLGLTTTHFLLPLPLTLLDGKPITFNLYNPIATFSHHFLFVASLVVSHRIYRYVSKRNVIREFLSSTKFYIQPSKSLIWATSITGLLANFYNFFVLGVWSQDSGERGVSFYIAASLAQYLWMPILLLFPRLFSSGGQSNPNKRDVFAVGTYVTLVLGIAISSNWRTILFGGAFFVVALFALSLLLGHISLNRFFTFRRLVPIGLAAFLIAGPILDISKAMVTVRHERYEASAKDLFYRTIETYLDQNSGRQSLGAGESNDSRQFLSYKWDETYLSNSVLNRLVNFKIPDNCLRYAEDIGFSSPQMHDEFAHQLVALVPGVFLNQLGIASQDKIHWASYSLGDYLYATASGDGDALGSFVLSAFPGIGMSIFGYWYLLLAIPLFGVIFYYFDALARKIDGRWNFSYLFFALFIVIVNYFNDHHVLIYEIRFVIRTFFEMILSFLVVMTVFRFGISIVNQATLKNGEK